MEVGFDNNKYLKIQSEKIKERINMFNSKLYLEFGGKLFDDYHASRVLPGFKIDSKIKLLEELKDDLEVIICINAENIEKSKIRADYGITYDMDVLRLIHDLNTIEINVNSVVITMYRGQATADKFIAKLKEKSIKTYLHYPIKGYPADLNLIVSEQGYGLNEYIETTKSLVVVTAPGPCSGKLATCLSQLYHEHKRGKQAGYAKFETFPVWNLPLKHPVNLAYEASTADLKDINMIDPFHLEAYGISSINYNRDIETFPILKTILNKITGKDIYKSPTDMGVNMVSACITDEEIVKKASMQEVIRRYYQAECDFKRGILEADVPEKIKILMNELNLTIDDRPVICSAIQKSKKVDKPVIALQLPNGKIITGKQTELLSSAGSVLLNAIKELTDIPDEVYLLSPSVLTPILKVKQKSLYTNDLILDLQEVLIALSVCSATNPTIEVAISNLDKLKGCEAHSTHILRNDELNIFKNLKINITSEPEFYNS